jgi:tetratricopeptide (TPR) repeat protein
MRTGVDLGMERYDNIVKIEEMRKLADVNQYEKAMKILETMDTGKIKALTDLSFIADVYMQNERYEEAMAVLTKVYGKTKTRRVLYQLVDLAIKRGNAEEAEDYLERYIKAAPQDSSRFIFRYCIDKLNGEPYEVLIAALEQLKEYEYYEMWAYELAKLYHKAGMKDKCVRECSDIILWFGEGIYVEKAKLLKGYYVGEIDPIHMLKAKEKKEAEMKLGLDKTKDYSEMKSQIDRYLEDENTRYENSRHEDMFVSADLEEIQPETEAFYTGSKVKSFTMNNKAAGKSEEELIHTWYEQEKTEDTRTEETLRKETVTVWDETDTARQETEITWGEPDKESEETESAWHETETARQETESAWQETDTARQETESAWHKTETARQETESVWHETETARLETESAWDEPYTAREVTDTASEESPENTWEENPVVNDPELEAFFKRVARRLEREITTGTERDGEEAAYSQEEADKRVRIKEELITYRKIEVPKENESFEKKENQEGPEARQLMEEIAADLETVPEETVSQWTEAEAPDEHEYFTDDEYNTAAASPEQSMVGESTAGESFYNTKEHSYNTIYLPGKFDSIFSEAGMNYDKNFGYLVRMESTVKQIEECLEMILSDYTKINHLIITGEKKSGKTTLAKKISKALYGLNWINTNRVAKISALKLNGISLVNRKDKLVNSSLVIEEAGKLDTSAAEQLLSLIDVLNGNLFVILEDKEDDINRLLQRSPKLSEVFGSRVNLPEYSKVDILGFAFTYIQNYDYEFTLDVKRAFEKELEKIMDSVKAEEWLEAVMNLARKAKASADERNKVLLSDIIQARELNSEDFLYVRMEDFLWED